LPALGRKKAKRKRLKKYTERFLSIASWNENTNQPENGFRQSCRENKNLSDFGAAFAVLTFAFILFTAFLFEHLLAAIVTKAAFTVARCAARHFGQNGFLFVLKFSIHASNLESLQIRFAK